MQENSNFQVLTISNILPNRFQPRIKFEEDSLEQLAESIAKYGVIEPIVVRPVGNKFEIIAGERRYKASKLASKSTIPAIIVNLSDKESEELALLENVQRKALNPIEEAVSYKRILDMGYISREELSKKIGKPQTVIFNKIKLLSLSDEVQSYLLNNKISERHARSLLKITNLSDQVEMLHRIVNERLTVKQTDREIRKLLEEVKESNNSEKIENLFDDERGKNVMDIDKILNEAKDLNPEPVDNSQMAPNLMVSDKKEQIQEVIPQNEEVKEEPILDNNKFVNPASLHQEEDVKKSEPNLIQNSSNSVTFDSMFKAPIDVNTNNGESNDINLQSNLNSLNNNQTNSAVSSVKKKPKKDISSIVADAFRKYDEKQGNKSLLEEKNNQNLGIENSMNNVQTSIVEPTLNNVQAPIVEPTLNNVQTPIPDSATNNVQAPIPDSATNNVQTPIPDSAINNVQAPIPDSAINNVQAPIPDSAINNVQTPIPDSAINNVQAPIQEPTLNNVQTPIPDSAINNIQAPNVDTTINNIPDSTIINDNLTQQVNLGQENSANLADSQEVNSQQNISFSKIVKRLRECADEIEKNGYFVNVDEIDLGNQYKVTFTIEK